MSCSSRIKNTNHLTDTENRIAAYILEFYDSILYDTAQTLAEKTSTSPAALIRFSRKLGYNGFSQLKMDLAKESGEVKTKIDFYSNIKEKDDLSTLIHKAEAINTITIEQTYQLLNQAKLQSAVDYLKTAERIFLFGIGASAICCQDLAGKLSRIGKNVIFFQDFHTQLPASYFITKKDAALAISYSGHTREVLNAVKHAKEQGACTISITQMNNSPLHRFSDILLFLPVQEKNLRLGAISSRNASLILTDLLYFGLISDELDYYKNLLASTRALVDKIRK